MPVPVFTGDPLLKQKRVPAMGWARERPLNPKVRTEANDKHALAFLRHAVICGVHQGWHYVICQSLTMKPTRCTLFLKAEQVFKPILFAFPNHLWKLELQKNVLIIVSECRTCQTFNVFKNKRLRP